MARSTTGPEPLPFVGRRHAGRNIRRSSQGPRSAGRLGVRRHRRHCVPHTALPGWRSSLCSHRGKHIGTDAVTQHSRSMGLTLPGAAPWPFARHGVDFAAFGSADGDNGLTCAMRYVYDSVHIVSSVTLAVLASAQRHGSLAGMPAAKCVAAQNYWRVGEGRSECCARRPGNCAPPKSRGRRKTRIG